jgi:hypothetical protein
MNNKISNNENINKNNNVIVSIYNKIYNYVSNLVYSNRMYKYKINDIDHSRKLKLLLTFIL